MKRRWIGKGIKIALFVAVALVVLNFGFMTLWNGLMPALFGWHAIGFWQAAGLLVLSRILFGGLRGRGGHPGHWRRRWTGRWEQMTPDEKEKFREGMKNRCGHWGAPETATKV